MREIIVPQSITWKSMFRPILESWSCITWLMVMIAGRSEGATMTSRSPL